MSMVSMKTEGDSDCCMPVEHDCCPVIYLNDEQVKALGIQGMPPPGTEFTLQARSVVTSIRAEGEEPGEGDGKIGVYLTLKIVEMQADVSKQMPDAATMLYGS